MNMTYWVLLLASGYRVQDMIRARRGVGYSAPEKIACLGSSKSCGLRKPAQKARSCLFDSLGRGFPERTLPDPKTLDSQP